MREICIVKNNIVLGRECICMFRRVCSGRYVPADLKSAEIKYEDL